MENATIVSWLKSGKRLTAELEQCEKSILIVNSNTKIGTSPIKGASATSKVTILNAKGKDKENDIILFSQFNEEARKEWNELLKQRENAKQLTMKKIISLKVLFDAVREKLGDIHLLNNSAQNNFQDMLETFESKLTSFKLSMKSEFDSMEGTEASLAREMMKVKVDIDSWENSTNMQSSSPGGHTNNIAHSSSSDTNTQQIKKNLERQKKDVDRKAIIGTLDRKVSLIYDVMT